MKTDDFNAIPTNSFTMNKTKPSFTLPVLFIGFLIWLLATVALRFGGQFFFITESPLVLTTLYIIVVPAMALLALLTFKRYRLVGLEQIAAAALLVLPGMLIDTFAIQFFDVVFPNMPSFRAASFGSWLMWAYSTVLVTAVISGLKQKQA